MRVRGWSTRHSNPQFHQINEFVQRVKNIVRDQNHKGHIMKHLIIYTHLNPDSFTKAVADEVKRVSELKGHQIKVVDLYVDGFDPVLQFPDIQYSFMGGDAPNDVESYQELITWADHLTFVYPLWWQQMPAMLKGFIDRVFTNGFAYMVGQNGPEGMLAEKSVQLIINSGTPNEMLESMGFQAALLKVNEEGIFKFCGMRVNSTFFGNITMSTDSERKEYLKRIDNIIG